jgi:hypothetical protein
MLIVRDSVDGSSAIFRLEGVAAPVIVSANALYSITKDNAATYNVYYETDQFKIQCKVAAGNRNTRCCFFGM